MGTSIVHHNKWFWGDTYTIILEGGSGIVKLSADFDNSYACISGLSVIPEKRKQGLGRKLLEKCEEISKDLGFSRIWADVEKDTGPIDFYLRLGWVENLITESEDEYIEIYKDF